MITALVIAGYAYARGGLLYSPGPLNTQGDQTLGGVTSHAEIGGECSACHTAPWDSATMADRCVACHTDIAAQLQDEASLHGTLMSHDPVLQCRACHPEHRGADAPLTRMDDLPAFPHEAVGFSLNGHQQTAAREPFQCTDCHHEDITTFTPNTCDTCHRQMNVQYMTSHVLSFGSACLACHDGVDRFGENFDHNVFSFQLTGQHAVVECVQCHIGARAVEDFASIAQDCYSCHQQDDAHDRQFGTDCAVCHTTAAWTPAEFNGPHTFPMNHGGAATCATCHPAGLTSYTCYGCHEHEESDIREEHLDEGISDFQNCVACHATGQKDEGEDDDDN